MGKKAKTGKSRKDKFYHLAKETGYRARSAFKLLQLNRKFEFLQKSRVCVDLCAAPGGWLQVAAQHMPISSIIIGVDLVPIKPIPNTVTFQEDITTEKCKQTIKKELQTWKADVFLNDGAPNVGKNWIHDAFQQAELTLAALKLATAFLKKNGWFVTKVFRSKDYQALMWVFRQMFKRVHATKPQASRNESAEIFVVCQGYLAPDTIDPKFLDPKFVFKDVGAEPKSLLNLVHPEKRNKKAHGYAEGDYTLHHKATVTQFITSSDYLELLAECHMFTFDNETMEKHELTTAEIKECCKDIKVLGKKELRSLLSWRKKMKEVLAKMDKDEDEEELEAETAGKEPGEAKAAKDSESETDSDEEKLEQQLEDLKDEQRKDLKKKRKKVMREKRKLRDKMSLGMVIPGDRIEITDDVNLFNLKGIKRKQDLKAVSQKGMEEAVSDDDEDLDELEPKNKKMMMAYDRYGDQPQDDAFPSDDEEEAGSEELDQSDAEEDDLEMESGDESAEEKEENPLVVQMESKDARTQKKLDMWFNKDAFTGLEDEKDEDLEIEKMVADYKERGGTVIGKDIQKESSDSGNASDDWDAEDDEGDDAAGSSSEQEGSESSNDSDDSDDSDDNDDDDDDFDFSTIKAKRRSEDQVQTDKKSKKSGFEEVPASAPGGKVAKLDPIGLAIGAEMIKSSKRRRDIVEMSYNRYTSNDSNLPDWFAKDEARHCKKQVPVTKDQVQEYKAKSRAINARPIKKIAEAKARKKRKSIKKLEKARKKADAVSDTVDVTDKEKWKAIKDIYKRAGLLKKKKENTTYVVAKKGGGQKVRRPAGVKGRYKVVDPRMKKDMRAMKTEQRNQKGAKGGRQRGGGRGKKR